MFWYGNGMNGWGYGLMTFSTIVFWVLVIAAVVLVIHHFTRPGGQRGSAPPPGTAPPHGTVPPQGPTSAYRPTPEQLLAERFARGEIDEEEYRSRLSTLRAESGAQSTHQR